MFKSGYFISIGAGKNQLPLILTAKELGLKVISIDQNPTAPGFQHSQIKIFQSVLEYRKIYSCLLKLVLEEPILAIGVRSYGKAVLTSAYLAQKFQLPGTDVEVLKKFYNKKTMKAFLGEKGIPVPKSFTWQNGSGIGKFLQSISYPCILKPVNNIAKRGIELFYDLEGLLKRITEIRTQSDHFLLEEFIEGSEVTVIGFVQNKKFHLISISDKVTTSYPPFLELSHRLPSQNQRIIGEINLICQNITLFTGLTNSPFVAEFKVNERGEIYLIEVMPEVGGEYLADFLIPEHLSYNYFLNYIRLLTGNPIFLVDSKRKRQKGMISQICFIAPPEGKSRLVSYGQFMGVEGKVYLNETLKRVGDELNTNDGNSCRIQVIGVSSSAQTNQVELDASIRKNCNAKYE